MHETHATERMLFGACADGYLRSAASHPAQQPRPGAMAMSDDRLVHAARTLLDQASGTVEIGSRHDRESYVLVPARCLTWLEKALTPEERTPTPYVSIQPNMRSGDPCIGGHRLGAIDMAERYWHLGEHVQSEILDAYELTHGDLVAACYYAATFGSRTWRKRWDVWLQSVTEMTCEGIRANDLTRGWYSPGLADCPLPPHKNTPEAPR